VAPNLPAGQLKHAPAPTPEYWPEAQSLHEPIPTAEYLPATHVPVTAEDEQNDPAGQFVHALDPVAVWYLPAAQLVQEPETAAEYVPAAQLLHAPAPTAEYWPAEHVPVKVDVEQTEPAGQLTHATEPVAAWYWPTAQLVQEPAFGEEIVPAAQLLHEPTPAAEYCPAAQVPVTAVVEHAEPAAQLTHAIEPVAVWY